MHPFLLRHECSSIKKQHYKQNLRASHFCKRLLRKIKIEEKKILIGYSIKRVNITKSLVQPTYKKKLDQKIEYRPNILRLFYQ